MAARARWVWLGIAMLLGAGPPVTTAVLEADAECRVTPQVPFQLRPATCELAQAVARGMEESETFRSLVERIGALKGIVYVNAKYFVESDTRRVFEGTLQHRVVKAGDYRLLYVTVAPGPPDRRLPILAHELQHAIEVLGAGATTEAAVDALFQRIGVETSAWAYETGAAEQAQARVARELAARRR